MDTARHVLGIVLIVGMPPAVLFWLIVHPLARFWRRSGPRRTYSAMAVVMTTCGASLYVAREQLLGQDLGTNWILVGFGAVLYLTSVWVSLLCKKELSLRAFAGLPEVSQKEFPGRMLQQGIYGLIRHPRYLSVGVGTLGFALVINYRGAYVVVLTCLLAFCPLIVLEERELVHRFGAQYLEYRSRVPALVPRFRKSMRTAS